MYTADEWANVSREYLEASGRYVRRQLREFQQLEESAYSPTDAEELRDIRVPLLLMHGTRSSLSDWFQPSVQHISEHVDDTRIKVFEGLSHAAPMQEPETLAHELRHFFEGTLPRPEAPQPGVAI